MIQKTIAKKLAYILSAVFALLALSAPLASVVSAQVDNHNLCEGANLTFDDAKNPCQTTDANGNLINPESKANTIVADVINIFSVVVGLLAVFMIVYGGFRFVTSAGNPESTKTAKNAILYAIIGLVIVAFAQIIVKFVLSKIVK